MGERHADQLFSGAIDGVLAPAERAQLDRHLEGCASCSAAFEAYRRSVAAVRSLPPETMPVPVRLPPTPPVALREGALARLRRALTTPLAVGVAAGVVTTAAAAAVTVALTRPHEGPAPAIVEQAQATSQGAPRAAAPAPTGPGDAGAAQACDGGGQVTLGLAGSTADLLQPGASFPNATTAAVPGRPGELLVLATPQRQYRAGDAVRVEALLLTPSEVASGRRLAGSCVRVTAAGQSHPAATMEGAAAARPAGGADGGLSFTIPRDLPAGTTLTITATVPPGVPSGEGGSVVALLVITVR